MKHLSLKIHIPKKAVRATTLFLLLAANQCAGAGWAGTDDFSVSFPTNWGFSTNWTVMQNIKGVMSAVCANGHASFLVPLATNAEQNAAIIWYGTPTAADSWIVDILGHNSAYGSSCQLQLAVLNADAYNKGEVYGFVVSRVTDRSGDSEAGTSWWSPPSNYTHRASISTTSTNFGLRLVFQPASQTIQAWYDPTASGLGWTNLDSMTLSEFSPGMAATNRFAFVILGNTDAGPILEGQIWADNFRAFPTPPMLLVAGAQRLAGSAVLNLTWTNNGSICVLESAGALTAGWGTVSTPWTTNANWISAIVTNSSSMQFYRLRAN